MIVEASARSGALNTAGHAERLSRPLMAVPGPVTSAMSVGCHDLIRSDRPCDLVAGVDDVVAMIGSSGDLSTALEGEPPGGATPTVGRHRSPASVALRQRLDELDPVPRAVYDGLPVRREISVDELAASCALSVTDVIRNLPALELAGLIERTRDGYRRCPARGAPS